MDSGALEINNQKIDLKYGQLGYDYVRSVLPYKTYWKWGIAMGYSKDHQ